MTSRVPDLPALRLLVAVARLGSIGAAARELGITQQAASERLRAVEAQTGLVLVRRGARGSEPTRAGVVVVEWATRLLDVADEIDHALEGLRGERGRELDVASSMTVAETVLPRWLVLLRQRQESEGLRPTSVSLGAVNSVQAVAAVVDGSAHVGFVEGARAPTGVRSVVVADDELVLVAAATSPLGRRRSGLEPDEVARLGLTGREAGSGTREVLEVALRAHGLVPETPVVELTTSTAVREAVVAGSAPAVLSRRLVGRELAGGQLVRVPTPGLDLSRSFRAVWLGSARPPSGPVRELVGIARQG